MLNYKEFYHNLSFPSLLPKIVRFIGIALCNHGNLDTFIVLKPGSFHVSLLPITRKTSSLFFYIRSGGVSKGSLSQVRDPESIEMHPQDGHQIGQRPIENRLELR